MTDRPTPEQVIMEGLEAEVEYGTIDRHAAGIIARLADLGYVIVHPDDVPTGQAAIQEQLDPAVATERVAGWDACRRHIFGEGS